MKQHPTKKQFVQCHFVCLLQFLLSDNIHLLCVLTLWYCGKCNRGTSAKIPRHVVGHKITNTQWQCHLEKHILVYRFLFFLYFCPIKSWENISLRCVGYLQGKLWPDLNCNSSPPGLSLWISPQNKTNTDNGGQADWGNLSTLSHKYLNGIWDTQKLPIETHTKDPFKWGHCKCYTG